MPILPGALFKRRKQISREGVYSQNHFIILPQLPTEINPKITTMNLKIFTPKVLIVTGIILFAAIMRLLPHYPNFTPVAALALFGGAHFGKRWLAFLVPLAALFLSDLFLGFHGFMVPVYLSFALVVLLGTLIRNNVRIATLIGGAMAGSVLFFLITNFAVWMGSPFYPQTFAGLLQSYTMAIPFFHTSLLGDLFYSGVFFGGFYLVQQYYPSLKEA
jgi:hypothetical protein